MGNFKRTFLYYFKDTFLNYSYLVIADFLGFLLMSAVNDGYIEGAICSLLAMINLLLYLFIVYILYSKTGEEAMKLRHSNDIDRRHMLETRTYHEIDRTREYRPVKMLYFCLWTCLPILILTGVS
ncbi:MAG: hypothetical protein MJ072_06195, partial [Clostridia bacterium]|nr:hypothetical protein [Clostridia bacterium]